MVAKLFEQLRHDLKSAMLNHEDLRKDTIRLIIAAFKKIEADTGKDVDDDDCLNILLREKKTRQESVEQYRLGGREDLAQRELAEISIIDLYLPVPMSDADVEATVARVMAETEAVTAKDMGKVMAGLGALRGKADMKKVSALVRAKLS